jgi:pSer/pThr/pTyr-binding forkhead associated (FHA) protein
VEGNVVNQYELNKAEMRVGRQKANDVYVASERVSRHHAKIRWENGAWVIEDMQSLNGLNYQGELVDRHRFKNKDRIYLAPQVVLTYEEESPVVVANRGTGAQPSVAPVMSSQPVSSVMSPAQPVAPAMVPQKEWIVVEAEGKTMMARPLDKDVLTIGRQPGSDIRIPLQQVSGQHAVLKKQDGRWQIVDMKSRNGLVYEGRRIERHTFSKGDCVYLAPNVMLRFDQT